MNYPGYKSINLIVRVVKGYQLLIDAKLEREKKIETAITISPTPTRILGPKIRIKETETGWLRVRETASNGSLEVGRANPGETYEFVSEESGWYQIVYKGKNAWVSAKYAEKISE
ncbi:TPA: hypothetical protein DD455_04780 [Candidatus Shapirobacteria bacterium]|nr:hypothetical protein [Candidatus Shapirobacteria bacterium]